MLLLKLFIEHFMYVTHYISLDVSMHLIYVTLVVL